MKKIRDLLNISGKKGTDAQDGAGPGVHTRRKKIIVGIAAVLGVLLVLAAIAPFLIDLNKYKGPILSKVRPAIHRDVDFDSIRLTILTGLGAELKGLRIPENPAFTKDNFVSINSVQVRLQFLPLLRGHVRIARLIFKSPVVHVRRNNQGVFNFADMVPPKEEKEKKSKMPAILASFGISDLSVKNGTLLYEDRKIPEEAPAAGAPPAQKNITVSRLDAAIENISLTDAISIDASASLLGEPDRNFSVTGKVGPVGIEAKDSLIPVDLVLKMDALSLKKLTESLGLSSRALSGVMNGDVTVKGSVKGRLDIVPKLTVKDLVMAGKPGAPVLRNIKPASLALDGRIAYDGQPKDITIQDANLGIGPSRMIITGKVQHVAQSPAWNISLRSTALDPGSLMEIAPAFGVALPADLRLKGPARLQVSSTGTSQDMAVEAGMELSTTEISMGSKFHKAPGVTCTLGSLAGIKQGTMTFRSLNLVLYNLALSGTGEIAMKAKPQEMNIQLASKPASLQGWDALIPSMNAFRLGGDMAMKAGITGTTKAPQFSFQAMSSQLGLTIPPDKTKKDAHPTPVSLRGLNLAVQGRTVEKKLAANGTFGIGGGKYAQIDLGKTAGSFSFNKGRLDVPSLQVGVFGGTVNASASYLATTKDWTFSPVIKGISAGQAMNTMTSFKDIFTGTLSGRMQIRGNSGSKGADALATQGTFTIDKGTMNNMDLMQSVIDGLTGVPGLSGLVAEQSAVQRNKATQFDALTADFGFARKVLTLNSMKLSNIHTAKETNSLATLQGTVDMATRKLGMKGSIVFSPEYSARLAKRTPPMNALQNDQHRIDLPIQITGTVNRPVLFLQTREIAQAVASYYTKQGVEKGLEKLKKKFNIPGTGGTAPGKDGNNGNQGGKGTGNAVDDFLKGVLGK
jgi:uncharacterized protein involved in outer membrane biogenesis